MSKNLEGYVPSSAEIKKAEGMMTEEQKKMTQERIAQYEKNAKDGFDLLSHDLESKMEPDEHGHEESRVFSVELRRLREFPELRKELIRQIISRDQAELILEDERVVGTGGLSLSNTWGGTQSRTAESSLRIYTKEQANQIHRLREELDKEFVHIGKIRRSFFDKTDHSAEESSAYDKEEDALTSRVDKITAKFEPIFSEAKNMTDISSEEREELLGQVLKGRGVTLSGRVLEVNGDNGRLDFGTDGSSAFAREMLIGTKMMNKGIDKTLFAFETDFPDEEGHNRQWTNKGE